MDKPLHVQVAEALGWEHIHYGPLGPMGTGALGWMGDFLPPENWYQQPIPRYDTDWSALGPIIERLSIHLDAPECPCGPPHSDWRAEIVDQDIEVYGSTPLVAICNLILALHAAGKLEPAA